MPHTDDCNMIQQEDSAATAATDSSLRVSRSSDASPCLPPSVSPDDAVSSAAFDGYKGQECSPDACSTDQNGTTIASSPLYQTSGAHVVRRWKRSEFMCLRKLDKCTTLPEELKQDRPEIKALLKPPETALRERASLVPAAPLEGRNPKVVDMRFGRDETPPVTESIACAWRKKPVAKIAEAHAPRLTSHDAWELETSTAVADDWLMPTGSDDFDLSKAKNDVATFEEMRKQARQEWAGTSPDADSETEDVLHQLMAESMGEMENQSENGSNAVQALQSSQQIDVRSLFVGLGGPNSTSEPGSDVLQQQPTASTSAQSGSFSAFSAGGSTANMPVDMRQVSDCTRSAVQKDPVDPAPAPVPQNSGVVRDPVHQQSASSVELGGDGSSIWGGSAMSSGRLAQDAPVSEVDWKMMREIWNRPTSSAEGVQQQMPGMKPADSCIGSGQRTAGHFGGLPPHQQHAPGPNVHEMPGVSGGMEPTGEANAMKVLMQLWNTNSEQSASTAAPVQGNPAPDVRSAQQDLSQQLMAFHQQHEQKQQAQRQAAPNGAAMTTEQMLEQLYQQQPAAALQKDRAREPAVNDPYAMGRAGHGNSQSMANYSYRQTGKPMQQQNGMPDQYSSQAHQLATVLWFQASMAQAAQTQRHQQQAHASSVRRPMMQDMHRAGGAPVNAHSAALLQQLQQGHGTSQLSHDQYSAAAAAAVAAAQQQNMSQQHMSQTLRNQGYGAEQKQHHYAPTSNVHMMRPGQGHTSQHNSAQVPNYAESVVRAMLLPTAARQHQAQHMPQYRQPQSQVHPRYNNPAAAGLHMQPQQTPNQHPVAQSGFAHAPGSVVAPNNFSRLYDTGRMRR